VEVVMDPLMNYMLEVVMSVVGVMVVWGLKEAAEWVGVEKNKKMMEYVENAVWDGVDYVSKQNVDVSVEMEGVMAEAVQMVMNKVPKYMEKLGLDAEEVAEMVRNRL